MATQRLFQIDSGAFHKGKILTVRDECFNYTEHYYPYEDGKSFHQRSKTEHNIYIDEIARLAPKDIKRGDIVMDISRVQSFQGRQGNMKAMFIYNGKEFEPLLLVGPHKNEKFWFKMWVTIDEFIPFWTYESDLRSKYFYPLIWKHIDVTTRDEIESSLHYKHGKELMSTGETHCFLYLCFMINDCEVECRIEFNKQIPIDSDKEYLNEIKKRVLYLFNNYKYVCLTFNKHHINDIQIFNVYSITKDKKEDERSFVGRRWDDRGFTLSSIFKIEGLD
jgi:hypothetical protein